MSGGGLMQLVAYGAQDIYLTGNPQITFFKVVYRRHTNFAMEAIEQTFMGQVDFGKRVSVLISRNGDLIHRMYFQTELPEICSLVSGRWTDNVGDHLIRTVEVEIGGQRIDKQYGDWLHIWNALSLPVGLQVGYDRMTGHVLELTDGLTSGKPRYTLFIPFQFWFNRNAGLALPLIALQYHEVKINMELRTFAELWIGTADNQDGCAGVSVGAPCPTQCGLGQSSLWVDYIYLDTDERRRFAQVSHEYLIEQLQFNGDETVTATNNKLRLTFNHPTKEIVWIIQKDCFVARPTVDNSFLGNQWSNYQIFPAANDSFAEENFSQTAGSPNVLFKIQLNGHDRFQARIGRYFNEVQTYQHHTRTPISVGIYVYSFALRPEEHQPSGSVNFSRIDNANLIFTLDPDVFVCDPAAQSPDATTAKMRVYAVNYNVLRVMSGMGGVAYSN